MMAQRKSPEGIQYSGFFDALLKIPRQEGFMALYKVRRRCSCCSSCFGSAGIGVAFPRNHLDSLALFRGNSSRPSPYDCDAQLPNSFQDAQLTLLSKAVDPNNCRACCRG